MSEQKEHNNCCHYCRISRNRKRKKFVPYLPCKFCPNVFCYNCVVNHLHLNFEETLNDPTFKCLPCHEKCCCCKTECTINHRHCFTYIRTKKRYEKARQWKEKNRGDDDGGSNSDQSEDGDLSGSVPIQNGMMAPGIAGTFSAFSPQSANKFNINGNSYANPMLPGPNPEFYTPTRPLQMPLPNNGPNMQPNSPMLYRGPNDPSFNQPMTMRSPNSFNYGAGPNPGMSMNGSPFVPAIPNSVPMPSVNGSPNTQPKSATNQPNPSSQNMPFYNPAQGGFMPFRRPVSQTGFDEDPSPKRLKTSHNGSPSSNAWPPLVSNIGESQSNGNAQGALMMPPMSNNPNLPYFPFPGAGSSPFMNSLGSGASNGNSAQQLIKSDTGSPASNESHGNNSPQLPKPTRSNEQSQNSAASTQLREEPYRNYMLPPSHLPFFGRPWDDMPAKESNNGGLSLSGLLHSSTGSTSSAGEGSGPGNKDSKSGVGEMNGHHAMMNGHNFSAQSHLAHHNELNEAQNGKNNAHEGLHGELTAL